MTTNTKTITDKIINKMKEQDNTSKKIRFLSSEGFDRSTIVKILNENGVTTKKGTPIIYQFVRNVLNQKVGSDS